MAKQSICLCMIVKNEAPVIAACLASVLPIIDYWIVCDTGSSDGTQQIIADFFAEHDKPGELHERPWQDFAHNRTEALALARSHSDYTLIIDADDLLVLPPRFRRPHLTADAYTMEIHQLERMYPRTQLVRSVLPWRYEGVLHEFLSYADPGDGCRVFPETRNQQSLRGVQIHMGQGGARRRTDTAVRFAHDAAILKQALATETDSFLVARYTFYLAQSLRDSGDAKAALPVYLKRAQLGFWQQEVYFSLYEAARVMVTLGHQPMDVVAAFWRATVADPCRAEAFHGGARYCREQSRFKEGYKFAKAALGLTLPSGALFAEPWIYEYGLLDEFAVNAFWVGDYKGCLTTCRRLLALGRRLPQEYRTRLEANARLAKEKLHQPKDVSAPVHVEVVNEQPDVDAETIEKTASVAPQLAQSLPNLPDPDETQQDRPKQAKAGVRTLATTRTTNTLHVLGVAHTIPHEDYVVCAFTGKVLAFPDIIQPFGWNVVEYSNEGSASRAREHIPILSRDRLRALSLRRSREEPMDADVNNKPLQEEYQRVLVEKISARAQPGDIVCHVFGPNMPVYDALPKCHHIEMSVGYTASPGLPFRIYESSAWMHWHHGKAGREDGQNYHWVIPSGFDVQAWPYCAEPGNYAIFLGRVTPRKGVTTLIEIARRMPDLPILVYGPGDTAQWEADRPPNLHFKGPIFGAERVEAVRRARCMLMPTGYIEPFGFSGVEAQLCGVPLLGTSFGAFQETIIDGVTGFRCHTLADWIAAIRRSPTLDRKQISDIARRRYSREAIGQQYNWTLEQLADLSGPGWYGEVSRKFPDPTPTKTQRPPRIWLYMPHFGAVPNYFQLYLNSLARNADLLSVIFITDVDLSSFSLPDNLIVVRSTLGVERQRAATFVRQALGMDVDATSLLTTPYKFVDLKITYLDLFRDIGADHGVTENDYVGWGDCDLIYGRLADFISMETDYAVIGGFHGHFTAFKNIEPLRTLYRQVEQLPSILLDHNIHGADEIAFRPYLLKYLEETNGHMFYTNRYFCDIVPEQFFGLFRTDHASRPKNFFDAYNSDKDIDHVQCDQDDKLIVHYDDGTTREAIYCHLQKRKMALSGPRQAAPFMIREDAFVSPLPPPPVALTVDNEDVSVAESDPAAATTSPSPPDAKGPNLGTFGEESLIDQHPLRAARTLYSIHDAAPRVLVAILAKQKEAFLPLYLECIEALDYPKSSIVLYVRTNNNTDDTETILRDWLARVGHLYAHVEFDSADVDVKVEQFGAHEWNAQRFQVLGHIRNVSLQAAKTHNCDYYFVADVDNFIRPCTLRELVALRLPVVSPLLRSIVPGAFYSNYHAEIDANGYFRNCDQYQWILNRWIRGVVEVPVVHCTYLVRTDVINQLTYLDGSARYEYVVFSDSVRKAGVPHYVDNRQVYGYITFGEGHDQYVVGGPEQARNLIAAADDRNVAASGLVSKTTQTQTFLNAHSDQAGDQQNRPNRDTRTSTIPCPTAEALQKVRGEPVRYFLLSHHGHLVAEERGRLIQIGITAEAEEANLVEIDLAAELTAAAKFDRFIGGSDHIDVPLTLPVLGAVVAHVNLVKSEVAFVKDNLFITAEPGGDVACNRNQRLAWESFLLISREGVEQLREILTSSWIIASRRQLVHPSELSLVGGPALVCSDLRIPLCHSFPLDPRHFPFRFPVFVDGWRVEQLIKFQPMIYYVACGRNAVEELALSLESLVDIGGYRGRVSIYTDTMLEEIEDLFADIKTLDVTLLSLPAKDWVGFVSGRLKFIDDPQAAQSAPVAYFDTDIIFNRAIEPLLVDMVCANAPAAALEHFSKMATSPSVGAELLREDNFRLGGVSGFNAGAFSIPNVRDFGHVVEAIRNVLMNYLLIHGRDSLNWLDQAAANYISYRYVPFDTSDVTKYVRYGWSQDAYRLGPLTGLVHFCGIFRSHRLEPMRHYLSLLKSDRCRDHARIDAQAGR